MFREWEKLIQGTEPPTVSSVSAQVQGAAHGPHEREFIFTSQQSPGPPTPGTWPRSLGSRQSGSHEISSPPPPRSTCSCLPLPEQGRQRGACFVLIFLEAGFRGETLEREAGGRECPAVRGLLGVVSPASRAASGLPVPNSSLTASQLWAPPRGTSSVTFCVCWPPRGCSGHVLTAKERTPEMCSKPAEEETPSVRGTRPEKGPRRAWHVFLS